jgi:hypothetical protein
MACQIAALADIDLQGPDSVAVDSSQGRSRELLLGVEGFLGVRMGREGLAVHGAEILEGKMEFPPISYTIGQCGDSSIWHGGAKEPSTLAVR